MPARLPRGAVHGHPQRPPVRRQPVLEQVDRLPRPVGPLFARCPTDVLGGHPEMAGDGCGRVLAQLLARRATPALDSTILAGSFGPPRGLFLDLVQHRKPSPLTGEKRAAGAPRPEVSRPHPGARSAHFSRWGRKRPRPPRFSLRAAVAAVAAEARPSSRAGLKQRFFAGILHDSYH